MAPVVDRDGGEHRGGEEHEEQGRDGGLAAEMVNGRQARDRSPHEEDGSARAEEEREGHDSQRGAEPGSSGWLTWSGCGRDDRSW